MKRLFLYLVMAAMLMTGCYKDDIDDLNKKYDDLKSQYETVLNALNQKLSVTGVADIADGYKITFSDGKTVEVRNGKTPVFTIVDGNWHVDGVDTGVKAEGSNGGPGIPGKTPTIEGGYWYIDGVNTGVKAEGSNGGNGTDAPTITGIVIVGGQMEFTFSNDTKIYVPMATGDAVSFSVACAGLQIFQCGQTLEFDVTQSGVENLSISKPDGWKVSLDGNKISITAPVAANAYAERTGTVSVVAVGENGTAIAGVQVTARDYNYVIDFEDPRVADYLAGPTSYGENLYSGHPSQYVGYDDAGSGLLMMVNESIYTGEIDYFGGGVAISQWNDMATEGYLNQCSAYYSDATTGFGGHKGSKTFAVGFGYYSLMMGDSQSSITFDDGETECAFDHFWVTNNTYAALSMKNGDAFAKKFELGDWLKLIINAYDKDGNPTGTPVEFYMADFRTPASPGILTEWAMVDLTPLGSNVNTVKFDLQSTDTGDWGMNTPAYFCFDNLAIRK